MNLRKPLVSVVALAALSFGRPASATLIFDLDTGNAALSGFTGPFASVSVERTDATHATISFTSLIKSGNIYLLGDGGSVAVNINAASWTLGSLTGSNAGTGFTPGPYSDGGSGTEDGWGDFNQTINSFDGYTHSSDFISFVLTNTSGTWGADGDVLTANADGHRAAAHIFVTSHPADASNGAVATGFATDGVPPPPPIRIPEPGSVVLMGFTLVGLSLIRRKRAA